MYLLGKRADQLTPNDINRLVENRIQESKSLDYKRDLKLSQDRDKKEFLFDVTSMANTDGGCLIFGIEESKDEKGQNTGTPETMIGLNIENYDKLVQQIEDIVKGNTEPSISFLTLKHLVVDEKTILVIGISKALGLPVMVTFNEANKFYRRRNSGKYSVDVFELNQMFMQNQILKESAEKFRKERIENVRTLKVFPTLDISTSFFMHIIPFTFMEDLTLDLSNAEQMGLSTLMRPINLSGWDTMFNLDGYATWSGGYNPSITSYDQLFRNGTYEVYTSLMFERRSLVDGRDLLCMYAIPFIPGVLKKILGAFEVLKKFKVEPPFIFSISMMGMEGGVIYSTSSWGRPFLVNEIYLPPIVVPTYEADLYKLLKPTFDIIWQSVSESQSPPYQG